jgi:hypothetical protein
MGIWFHIIYPIHSFIHSFINGSTALSWALGAGQAQNKRTQTFVPRVGFELTTPVFQRTKAIHALERAAIVIGQII